MWQQIYDRLRQPERQQAGRSEEPSAGIIDSQSVTGGWMLLAQSSLTVPTLQQVRTYAKPLLVGCESVA